MSITFAVDDVTPASAPLPTHPLRELFHAALLVGGGVEVKIAAEIGPVIERLDHRGRAAAGVQRAADAVEIQKCVIDAGMLTAFDLGTGNVRWRVPSVGVVGLFFDDKEMLYVNSTTASPESLKYSRQIDVSANVNQVTLKVDAKDGKVAVRFEFACTAAKVD